MAQFPRPPRFSIVFGGEDKLIEPYGRNPLVEHTWFEGAVVSRDLTRQEELRVMTPWNCSVACKVGPQFIVQPGHDRVAVVLGSRGVPLASSEFGLVAFASA
jgi:hypothetical protein